jgi:hypothetical protein
MDLTSGFFVETETEVLLAGIRGEKLSYLSSYQLLLLL